MRIVEEFVLSKMANKMHCEDGIYYDDNFVVLIDGVTSKTNLLYKDKKSGEIAKDVIINEFNKLRYDCDKDEAIYTLNDALLQEMNRLGIFEEDYTQWLRASVVIYSNYYKEIWRYGDCQYMINGNVSRNIKEVDEALANIRSLVNQLYDINPRVEDMGRKFIFPLLIQQLKFENEDSKYGYPVLNGYSKKLLPIECVKVSEGDEIVFASDGYPNLKDTLEKSEAELKKMLELDPSCYIINKQTKGIVDEQVSFDDRSYIKFIVNQ